MNGLSAKNKEYFLALIFILLTVLFWGYSFISTKVVLRQIPPVTIAFMRQIIAALVLLPWLLFSGSLSKANLAQIGIVTASALFGIVMYFTLENTGLQFTTASNASMIVAALPVFTMASEALFFKLKVNWKMVSCLILSMFGVYLLVSVNGRLDFSSAHFLGNLLILGAMSCWVVYTILNKKITREFGSLTITAYQSLASIFLFLPVVKTEMSSWPALSSLTSGTWINLSFLGVFCSAFAYIFYIYAVKRLGATISAAFLNLIPVVTVICGFLILHEDLSLLQLAGMALVMFSLFKLSRVTPLPDETANMAASSQSIEK